ncbi:MAG: hypothetical protein ACK583_10335 [Cyanobacteriota bacterium]
MANVPRLSTTPRSGGLPSTIPPLCRRRSCWRGHGDHQGAHLELMSISLAAIHYSEAKGHGIAMDHLITNSMFLLREALSSQALCLIFAKA